MSKSSKFPSVGIILINWNNYDDSFKCFHSLKQLDYPNFEVIMVDNDSKDDSGKRLKAEFGDFAHFIFSERNLGFSGGNNLGFRYALDQGHDYVMELNNDTEVEPDFLSKLVASIDDKPEFGAAQPLIFFNTPRRDIIWNGGGKLVEPLGLSITKFANQKASESLVGSETDWITGCAFLIKSEVIRKTGLLREFFFFGSFEDVDLSVRIRKEGYKLWFEPLSMIYHSVGGSSKTKVKTKEGYLNPIVHYLAQRNQMIFINHHTPRVFRPLAVVVQVIKLFGYSLYFLVLWRPIKFKNAWRGFKDGLFKTYHD